jgi:hypothetical protein
MIKTRPYPDEFISGHIGRIRILNRLRNNKVTVDYLKRHLHINNRCNALAAISKLSKTEYIQKHTLIPLLHVYNPEHIASCEAAEFGSETNSYWDREPKSVTSVQTVKCCQSCVRYQLDKLGFSYWIRQHQIPGLLLCHIHKEPLIRITVDNAFENAPHSHLESRTSTWEVEPSYNNSLSIDKYSSVTTSLLSLKRPLKKSQLFIQKDHTKYFWGYSHADLKHILTKRQQIIFRSYPHSWINRYFYQNPQIFSEDGLLKLKRHHHILDRFTYLAQYDILAISAAFDTPEMTLDFLYSEF